ncbi:FKBP-type peptidyl-prolyl cis-trans isomerase [Streptomyces sp. SKN60]|uniref:FKBP-type peptidyl-prolyl cis-trans isomerase n=1 Tax=Streptomyces sp. SKN60 TaxID=2855506 RepID=UPI002245965B|nr:FKBP-type peptidyl-prolyl cis-trans isomerase [Streptomyces sp. SKN60]MCX2185009.1 FKBP-type peptidyl-prolyl cis-trans isomerase [Streptomyces sp. SKN60]
MRIIEDRWMVVVMQDAISSYSRRLMLRAAPVVLTSMLLVSGCTSGDPATEGRAAASAAPSAKPLPPLPRAVASAGAMPVVTGGFGREPQVRIPKSAPSDKLVVRAVTAGNGPLIRKGDVVAADYTATVWKSGRKLMSSYGEGGEPQVFVAGDGTLLRALDANIVGQKVGSRVLAILPPGRAFGLDRLQSLGLTDKDSVAFVLDLKQATSPTTAVVGKQMPVPDGLPQVRANNSTEVKIAVPAGPPPKGLVSRVLVQGSGPQVKRGQRVVLRYAGATWKENQGKNTAKLFASAWPGEQPFAIRLGTGESIKGWDQALVGQRAGTRLLLVIPPALGYGPTGHGPVPRNATLVYAVDILLTL